MPILSSLSVLGAHFSAPAPAGNWYDDTSDAHHAVTLNGSVTQSNEGNGVKAALFDGGANSITLAFTEDFAFGTGDFTVEAFLKQNDTNRHDWFVFGSEANPANRIQFLFDGSAVGYYNNNSPIAVSSVPGIILDVWHHVALSRSSGISRVFVDGVKVAEGSDSINYTANDFRISDLQAVPMNGKIANVRVVKGSALYTSDFTVPTSLPTAVSGTLLLLNFGAAAVPTV